MQPPIVHIEKVEYTNHINLEEVLNKLDHIIQHQHSILNKLEQMATDLTALTAAVAKDTEVDQSAITLLNGLKAALDAAGTDPVALKALSDSITASSDALSAAVVANTPAA